MPVETGLDDDYVARLLAEDAKRTSHKYAAQGLSAFAPKRRAADLPKPNTRFLSHIVREADHHNAALKRKEEQEAERRLRALRDTTGEPLRKRLRADESDQRKRSRMLKDVLGAAQSRSGRERHSTITDSSSQSSRQGHARRRRSGERQRSPDSSTRSRRRRSSSDSLARIQLGGAGPAGKVEREDAEPVRKRGRGAHKARSGIDEHFTKGYDPSHDVSLDSDHGGDDIDDDWDLALEAMRDRAKWKQNQASRMREAGFGESEISTWEKGANNHERGGDSSSVKWSRKGEIREWDAGKIEQ